MDTPKFSDFKKGFVFTIYSEGYSDDSIEDFEGFYTYTYGVDNWRTDEQIKQELENKNIYFS